jgi:hypothetical protein
MMVLVGALDDGASGAGLIHALCDELVLERLVEQSDGERDEVRERDEELEPEEDGECANEPSGADQGANESG